MPQESYDAAEPFVTPTMKSVLFTKGIASRQDARQRTPITPGVPDRDVRMLAARLVLEEALETVAALGFEMKSQHTFDGDATGHNWILADDGIPDPTDLNAIIDGACDTIYVATGALAACGVPDVPHLAEVCRANDSKFPAGRAIIDPETGKYLKPPGWRGPDHRAVMHLTAGVNLGLAAEHLIVTNSLNGGHA